MTKSTSAPGGAPSIDKEQQPEEQALSPGLPQNQQAPCALQAGSKSGATNKPTTMTTQKPNPAVALTEPTAGGLHQQCLEANINHCLPLKEESEAVTAAPLSAADLVDQTVHTLSSLQALTGECNGGDKVGSVNDASVQLENPAPAENAKDSGLRETASSLDPRLATQPVGTYPILDELKELLGTKVVLIPIPRGQKGPATKGWQNITQSQMQDPGYQAQLANGNIGILLGAASDGLCAVDIDSDEELDAFLAINPILADTLITKGARGAQLWVRVEGEYPPLSKIKSVEGEDYGEWRAGGGQSIIHGVHPSGVPYQRLRDSPPVTITFDQIVWPEHVRLPWVKDAADLLTEQFGPAYKLEGGLKINEFHFAAKFKTEHRVLW